MNQVCHAIHQMKYESCGHTFEVCDHAAKLQQTRPCPVCKKKVSDGGMIWCSGCRNREASTRFKGDGKPIEAPPDYKKVVIVSSYVKKSEVFDPCGTLLSRHRPVDSR